MNLMIYSRTQAVQTLYADDADDGTVTSTELQRQLADEIGSSSDLFVPIVLDDAQREAVAAAIDNYPGVPPVTFAEC